MLPLNVQENEYSYDTYSTDWQSYWHCAIKFVQWQRYAMRCEERFSVLSNTCHLYHHIINKQMYIAIKYHLREREVRQCLMKHLLTVLPYISTLVPNYTTRWHKRHNSVNNVPNHEKLNVQPPDTK